MFLKYSEMWDMDLGGAPSKNEIPHWFGNAAYVCLLYTSDAADE